ncbi:MAG: hypothetical protein JWN86_720 [Planctomycetota bacterium]|nr:hypothetical protein [Planctomycetota bacterium]
MTHLAPPRASSPPPPARGRRPSDLIPDQRRKHLTALALKRFLDWPNAMIANHFEIERRTLQLWYRRSERYPESATDEGLMAAVRWEKVLAALNVRAIMN